MDTKTPSQNASDASRRELIKKLGTAAYIAPLTVALLSSEKAAAY